MSIKELVNAVKWYTRGGLVTPLYFSISVLVALLILPLKEDVMLDQYIAFSADLLFTPLLAVLAALHVVRESQVTVFELGLLRSYTAVYFGRLAAFTIAMLVALTPLLLVLQYLGRLDDYSIAIIQKMLSYTAIAGFTMLTDSPKSGLILLVSFYYILPYGVPPLLNRVAFMGQQLPLVVAPLAYFLAPFYTTVMKNVVGSIDYAALVAMASAVLVVVLSYIAFKRKDFSI